MSSYYPDIGLTHPFNRTKSPLSILRSTVYAISSALWPVTILLHPNLIAPLSKA